jgi:hypothetical protein
VELDESAPTPAPSGRDRVLLRVAVGVAVALLAALAVLVVRPPAGSPPVDGSAGDAESAVEPDGVRSSPGNAPTEAGPTPVVPEDAGSLP